MHDTTGTNALPYDVAARLSAAEGRLYPLAMVDVERYQRATTLCGMLAQDLRSTCPDITSVLDRLASLVDHVPELAAEAGVDLRGLAPETLVDAAAAIRCRELQALHSHEGRQARISAAREAGLDWLVDEPSLSEVMAGSYRRVELHLATGTQLVCAVDAGTADRPTTYTVEELSPDGGGTVRTETFDDEQGWRRAVERYRLEISGHP